MTKIRPFREVFDGNRRRIEFDGTFALDTYPSGEPLVGYRPPWDIAGLMVQTASVADLTTAMFWVDRYRELCGGFRCLRLVLPYVPGARQDRRRDDGDWLFTVRSVARMINDRDFVKVVIADPHSDVAPALIDRCVTVDSDKFVSPPAGKYAAVVAPDAGAEKRAARVAKKLGVPLKHAWKTRDQATGALSGFDLEPLNLPAGSRILLVDDICDGGGTFVGLSQAITRQCEQSGQSRVKRDLFTTFGLYTKSAAPLLNNFDHVYCTDLVAPIGASDDVIVVPAADSLPELAGI